MCEHKGASIVKSIAEHSRAAGISDIGAPAERIRAYDLGKVMPLDLDIEEIVDELIRHANKSGVPNS